MLKKLLCVVTIGFGVMCTSMTVQAEESVETPIEASEEVNTGEVKTTEETTETQEVAPAPEQTCSIVLSPEVHAYCEQAASEFGIDSNILKALVYTESRGNAAARNRCYIGLTQLNPSNFGEAIATLGADPNDAYQNVLTKLNNIDMSTRIYAADSSSNNYELVLFIRNYVPTDMNTIILRTKYDIGSDSWVRINDNEPVPLYKDIDTPIKQGDIRANTIIQIRYNALQNIFYLINPDMYRVIKDVSKFTVDGETYVGPLLEIPINLDNYVPGYDQVDVYYENIKLFEGINFHFNGNNIVLDGFFANNGETFVFERTRCIASNL